MNKTADYLSISKMSEMVHIPESTVRRYCQKFSEFMTYKELAKGKKYSPETIEVIERISTLYEEGYETSEIKRLLSDEYAITITQEDEKEQSPTTNHATNNQIIEELTRFKQEQEAFNQQLVETIQKQDDYIKNSIEKRDRELMEGLRQLQETKKLNPPKKKWWKFW